MLNVDAIYQKVTLARGFKVQAPFANFLREILGKDEIGPKPYGSIGVTLPGFLSISYISFPHRPHSTHPPPSPSDLNWCKKVKSDLLCSKRGTSQDERLPGLPRVPLHHFSIRKCPDFRYSVSSNIPPLEIPYVGHRFSQNIPPPPTHICVFSIFAVFLTNYSYSR